MKLPGDSTDDDVLSCLNPMIKMAWKHLIEIIPGWTLCKLAFGMQSLRVTAYVYAIIQWYSVFTYLQYAMDIYDSEWHFAERLGKFHFTACFHLGPFAVEIWMKSPSDITAESYQWSG